MCIATSASTKLCYAMFQMKKSWSMQLVQVVPIYLAYFWSAKYLKNLPLMEIQKESGHCRWISIGNKMDGFRIESV